MRKRSLATVAALLVAAPLPLASTAGSAELVVPLGGYTAYVSATPVSIRLYEPVIPLPVEPQGELDLAFTQAKTSTGPDQRATASTAWPGAALGDGFATLTGALGLGEHHYPVVADATYPTGKPSASLSIGAGDMRASADGRTATATATSGPTDIPGVASLRNAASTSTVVVETDRITASAGASASDVVVAGGLLRVREVSATTNAASHARSATVTGRSVAAGVAVLGSELVVDEDGVHAPGHDEAFPALPGDPNDALRQLGITVTGEREAEEVAGATARYAAHALEVTVDTKVFKAAAEATGYREHYDAFVAALPKEIRDYVTDPRVPRAVDLQPRIVVTVGLVTATTSATPAWQVDLPDVPEPVVAVPVAPEVPPAAPPPTGGVAPEPRRDTAAPPAAGEPYADPAPVAFAQPLPELFGGLPPAVVVALLLGALVSGLGLRRLAAYAGLLPVTTRGCALGAAPGVPDLREEAP